MAVFSFDKKNSNSHFPPLIVFALFLTQRAPINITYKSDGGLAKGRDFHQTTVTDSGDLVSEWSHRFIVCLSRWVLNQFNILVLNKVFSPLGNKNLLGMDEMWSKLIEHYENNHCLVDESWPWT